MCCVPHTSFDINFLAKTVLACCSYAVCSAQHVTGRVNYMSVITTPVFRKLSTPHSGF